MMNSAAMNIGVHVSLSDLVFLVCMPRSGIARSYGNSIFSFLKSLKGVFLSVYAYQWDCCVLWQFYFQIFKESPDYSP